MNEPFQAHPNLCQELNDVIAESELQGGMFIKDLPVGKTLKVRTQNTVYFIDRVSEGPEGLTIQGYPRYGPKPIKAYILGSNFGGSMTKVGFVGRGMYMEFTLATTGEPKQAKYHGTIVTSKIQEVEEI